MCTFTWCIQSTGTNTDLTRTEAGEILGYPNCVNEVYGLMSGQCLVDGFAQYGIKAVEVWPTFEQAYAIAQAHTGGISPAGMYHWMALRGTDGLGNLWVANSAPGYYGIYDTLTREQYHALGPTKLIYLDSYV